MASTLPVWKIRKPNTILYSIQPGAFVEVRRLFRVVRKDRAISLKPPLASRRTLIKSVVPNCGYIRVLEMGRVQPDQLLSPALQAAWEMLIGGGGGGRVLLLTCRDLEWECLKQSWEVKTIGFQLLLLSVCGSLFIVTVTKLFVKSLCKLKKSPCISRQCTIPLPGEKELNVKWMSSANFSWFVDFFFF